jgi:hypothetical protein
MSKIFITLTNGKKDYDLQFKLLDTNIAQKWIKHLDLFTQAGFPWDDPKRFYNFPNTEYTEPVVAQKLRDLVATIKNYAPDIIDRQFGDIISQDDLNYLHHIFEVYHGLYDEQDQNSFYKTAPRDVQDALADLNIWIHRYETLGTMPRFVATWKYKPSRELIADEEFALFSLKEEWGDLKLNYCEIGKTLFDLWNDNDQHISKEAFKPLHYFCFDFTVRFSSHPSEYYETQERAIWDYFDQHSDYFHSLGYKKYDPKLSLGGITIAKIDQNESRESIIKNISEHQQMKTIKVI